MPDSWAMNNLKSGMILVTGAAGFIGSALIHELNNRGYENIIACDSLGTDDRFLNLIGLKFEDYFDSADLLGLLNEDKNLLNLSCIFHLGACAVTTERDCAYLMRNNYEYTKSIACFAAEHDIRFVYASSAATYGDGSDGMSDLDKIDKLHPLNMYAYSKQLFDLFAKKNHLPGYGMKYFNVFGPNEYHKGNMRSVVIKSYESILSTGTVKLFRSENPSFKDGEQMRDFVYIKDAVDMTIFLANAESGSDGLYNVASGQAHTWIELVTPVFKALNKPVNIEFVDMPSELAPKYQYYTIGKIDKIRKIGYKGKVHSLNDAVTDYVTNYLCAGNKRIQDVKI